MIGDDDDTLAREFSHRIAVAYSCDPSYVRKYQRGSSILVFWGNSYIGQPMSVVEREAQMTNTSQRSAPGKETNMTRFAIILIFCFISIGCSGEPTQEGVVVAPGKQPAQIRLFDYHYGTVFVDDGDTVWEAYRSMYVVEIGDTVILEWKFGPTGYYCVPMLWPMFKPVPRCCKGYGTCPVPICLEKHPRRMSHQYLIDSVLSGDLKGEGCG